MTIVSQPLLQVRLHPKAKWCPKWWQSQLQISLTFSMLMYEQGDLGNTTEAVRKAYRGDVP
jgi:hypothetical protein